MLRYGFGKVDDSLRTDFPGHACSAGKRHMNLRPSSTKINEEEVKAVSTGCTFLLDFVRESIIFHNPVRFYLSDISPGGSPNPGSLQVGRVRRLKP